MFAFAIVIAEFVVVASSTIFEVTRLMMLALLLPPAKINHCCCLIVVTAFLFDADVADVVIDCTLHRHLRSLFLLHLAFVSEVDETSLPTQRPPPPSTLSPKDPAAFY